MHPLACKWYLSIISIKAIARTTEPIQYSICIYEWFFHTESKYGNEKFWNSEIFRIKKNCMSGEVSTCMQINKFYSTCQIYTILGQIIAPF